MKDRYVNKAIVGMIDSVDDVTDTMCNILIHGINRKFLVPKWWTVANKVVVCFKGFQFRNKKVGIRLSSHTYFCFAEYKV